MIMRMTYLLLMLFCTWTTMQIHQNLYCHPWRQLLLLTRCLLHCLIPLLNHAHFTTATQYQGATWVKPNLVLTPLIMPFTYSATGGLNQPTAYYYQSFSSSDLLKWKNWMSPLCEKPQTSVKHLALVFQTQQPTWADCRQILLVLLNTEEWSYITQRSWAWL